MFVFLWGAHLQGSVLHYSCVANAESFTHRWPKQGGPRESCSAQGCSDEDRTRQDPLVQKGIQKPGRLGTGQHRAAPGTLPQEL